MRSYFILFFFFLFSFAASAQSGLVNGTLTDSLKRPVASATVTLQNSKDSSLISFTLSQANGTFQLKNIPAGSYRLLITHLAFHSMSRRFTLSPEKPSYSFDTLRLFDKAQVLPEFEIAEEAPPVTLRGDTLEFNGSSFKTASDAVVEDLLKKLPGVEVQSDGTIKVNGQTVSKVLVDGKEFFGSDPNVATQNLPADAIDKVQVFDKKSDNEKLTGMSDGNTDMAINLKLKKDHKKGAFGTVLGGYGYQDRYKGKMNVNRFENGRQLAVLANANNINERPFSFQDVMSFMGGLQSFGGGGDVRITISDDGDGPINNMLSSNKKGLNDNWSGGTHFGDDWGKKDQVEFSGSYFYNRQHPLLTQTSNRQYFLPDSTYYTNSSSKSLGYTDNHRLNFQLRYKIDSLSLLRIAPSFSMQNSRTSASDIFQTLNEDRHLSNAGSRGSRSGNDGFTFSNDALFQKSFARKGRSLSVTLNSNYRDGKSFDYNDNTTGFYSANDSLLFAYAIHQKVTQAAVQHDEALQTSWTEPLGKRSLLEISARGAMTMSRTDRETYDFNAGTEDYDLLHDQFSGHYQSGFQYAQGGFRFKRAGEKLSLVLGSSLQQSQLSGGISGQANTFSNRFVHLLPNAQVMYAFNKYRDIRLALSSSVNAPAMGKLMPVTNNSNPLYISTGNTALVPEQDYSLSLDFKTMDPFNNRHFFMYASLTRTENAIASSEQIDQYGITTAMPVNGAPAYQGNLFSSFGFAINKIRSRFSISPEMNYNRYVSYINNEENLTSSINYRPGFRWSVNIKDKVDISANVRYSLTDATYSLQRGSGSRYSTQTYGLELNWSLPKNLELESNFSYQVTESVTNRSLRTEFPLWRSSLSWRFTKSKRLMAKVSVYDILNKNTGVTRNINSSYIEDLQYNTLNRYYMFSLSWKLNKTGGDNKERGGMRIMIGDD